MSTELLSRTLAAESERDAALARVKELESQCSRYAAREESHASDLATLRESAERNEGYGKDQRMLRLRAESALASARSIIAGFMSCRLHSNALVDWIAKAHDWLSSHPTAAPVTEASTAFWRAATAPVAAPCADTCGACAAEILGFDTEEKHVGAACMHAPERGGA